LTSKQVILLREPGITDDATLDSYIELAEDCLSEEAFCNKYQNAVALQVLHWYSLSNRLSAGGPGGSIPGAVASLKEGDLQISFRSTFTSADAGDAELAQSKYGLELLALRRSCVFAARNRHV
jgi:hypothetical protein